MCRTIRRVRQSAEKGELVSAQIPMVDYLVLGDDPHLVANECTDCGARYFDRRNACASCGGASFVKASVATEGEVTAFTIVSPFMPGTSAYVPAVVDCEGTPVRANIVNVEPDPEHIRLGMKVRLTTFSIGADSAGTEAINYGFEPVN